MSSNIDKILEDIAKEGRTKADQIRKQGMSEIQEALERAKADAGKEAEQITRSAKTEADAARNKLVSQEMQKARLAYLTEKNKVVSEILAEVRLRLMDFSRNETSYREFLLRTIGAAVEAIASEKVKIMLSRDDLNRFKGAKRLEQTFANACHNKKATFSEDTIDTIGGAVVMSEDGRIRVDCTFESKLKLLEEQLVTEISKILFAP